MARRRPLDRRRRRRSRSTSRTASTTPRTRSRPRSRRARCRRAWRSAIAASLNFVGAFLSLAVAATIASGIVDADVITLPIVFAGLIGAIAWNLATWYFGLPSSSSHALIGGVVGADVRRRRARRRCYGAGLVEKVIVPALVAPVLALVVAGARDPRSPTGSSAASRPGPVTRGFRLGQLVSGSLFSLSHGTNDAQKTMGIIFLALVANGNLQRRRRRADLGRASRRPRRSRSAPTSAAGGSSARWAAGSSRWTRRRASRRRPSAPR